MNVRRLLVFTLLLWLATALAAFPFGFIEGLFRAAGRPTPTWTTIGQGIAVPVAAIAVIAALAKRQSDHTWEHALIVFAIAMVLSLPLNVWVGGQPMAQWAAGAALGSLVIVPAGVLIGRFLRHPHRT